MTDQIGTADKAPDSIFDTITSDERREFVIWSLIAFALGITAAWVGTLVWIAVRFMTT